MLFSENQKKNTRLFAILNPATSSGLNRAVFRSLALIDSQEPGYVDGFQGEGAGVGNSKEKK